MQLRKQLVRICWISKHCPNFFANVAKRLSESWNWGIRVRVSSCIKKEKSGVSVSQDRHIRVVTHAMRIMQIAFWSCSIPHTTFLWSSPPVEIVSIFSCKTQQWSVLVFGRSPSLSNTISDHGGGCRAVTQRMVPLCSGVEAIWSHWRKLVSYRISNHHSVKLNVEMIHHKATLLTHSRIQKLGPNRLVLITYSGDSNNGSE